MPTATESAPPICTPSSASSKLTALSNAPAPKPSTSPTRRLGQGRARPIRAPSTRDEAATDPHPSAAPTPLLRPRSCRGPRSPCVVSPTGVRDAAPNPAPMDSERSVQSAAPAWLRSLGISSWLLVGFALIIVGIIWLLAETSTIVMPVILAAVLGAVAGPAVGWLEGHRVPRIAGAFLILLGLVAIGVLIFCLVF